MKEHEALIALKKIDVDNFDDIIALSVREDQRELVTTNVESLAQVYVQPECIPLAVYDGALPVGFLMYCLEWEPNEYWLYRLMIDARYQGRGYGRAALAQVLERVKRNPAHHRLFLGVDPAGVASVALYQSLGFRFDGRQYGKEKIMVLEW